MLIIFRTNACSDYTFIIWLAEFLYSTHKKQYRIICKAKKPTAKLRICYAASVRQISRPRGDVTGKLRDLDESSYLSNVIWKQFDT